MSEELIYEKEYVHINGIEQFILHFPADEKQKKVVLFLHGGPGTSEATSGHYMLRFHKNEFHMVYYDQRGTGKTLMKNPDSVSDVETLLKDLHEIVEYLKKKYDKDKIVIMGHSWGAVLGALYVKEHKENVLAFIAAGQVVNKKLHEKARCEYLCALMKSRNKMKNVQFLQKLEESTGGTFDKNAMTRGQFRKIRFMQIANHMLQGASFQMLKITKSSPVYDRNDLKLMMGARKNNEKLYQYIENFNLYETMEKWPVKALFISGTQDFQAPFSLVKDYVEHLQQPDAEYYEIENGGHFALIDNGEEFFGKVNAFLAEC